LWISGAEPCDFIFEIPLFSEARFSFPHRRENDATAVKPDRRLADQDIIRKVGAEQQNSAYQQHDLDPTKR
jgi:hypothetical protein